MKRLVFLLAVLLVAQGAWAQSQDPPQEEKKPAAKPKPLDPADVETLTGRPYGNGQAEPAPKPGHALNGVPAPKKGHPLDWRDVDILTGKYDRARRQPYATPYVYAPVPAAGSYFRGSQFGDSQFSDSQFITGGNTRVTPLFAPRFGRFHNRNFFFDTGRSHSRFLFAPRFSRGSSFFFFH